jgi:hypothetical protein
MKIQDGDNYKVKAEIVHLENKFQVVKVAPEIPTETKDRVEYDLAQVNSNDYK